MMCVSLYKALSFEHKLFIRAQRRNAREEIALELRDNLGERVDEMVASGVDRRLATAVDEAVEEAVDAKVERKVDLAVNEKLDERVESAVASTVDEVAFQVQANTVAIQELKENSSGSESASNGPWDK